MVSSAYASDEVGLNGYLTTVVALVILTGESLLLSLDEVGVFSAVSKVMRYDGLLRFSI